MLPQFNEDVMASHKDLTGTDLHDVKGVTSATDGAILVANTGSSSWVIPCYAEMLISNNATAFTPVAADITQYKKLINTGWSSGVTNGGIVVNADNINDDITISADGDYFLSFWCSFDTGAASGTEFAIKYAIDAVTSIRKLKIQKNSTGTDTIVMAAQGIASLKTGEDVSIYISSSATTSLTITDGGLIITRLK